MDEELKMGRTHRIEINSKTYDKKLGPIWCNFAQQNFERGNRLNSILNNQRHWILKIYKFHLMVEFYVRCHNHNHDQLITDSSLLQGFIEIERLDFCKIS